MKLFEYYSPRLIIVEHFDYIINKLDIHTESLLKENLNDSKESEAICQQREALINQLNSIKENNLSHFDNSSKDREQEFEQKWSYLIEDQNIKYEEKIDIVKKDLIQIDCVLMVDLIFSIKYSLWLTDGFNVSSDLDFLRYFPTFLKR